MKFIGETRPGSEFRLLVSHAAKATATFVGPTVDGSAMRVTHRAAELFDLPDSAEILAHWHGKWRTEAFALTIGQLRKLKVGDPPVT